MVFCSFWSLEALLWTVIAYMAFLGAAYLEERGRLWQCAGSLILSLSCIAAAHLTFEHDHPRDLRFVATLRYLDLNYTTALVGQGWPATPAPSSQIHSDLEVGLCVAALSYGLSIVLWRTHAGTRARWLAVSLVLPGAVLCVMEMSYWISRTYDGLWWQQCSPAVVPLILMLDEMIMRNSRSLALQGPAAAATSTTPRCS